MLVAQAQNERPANADGKGFTLSKMKSRLRRRKSSAAQK